MLFEQSRQLPHEPHQLDDGLKIKRHPLFEPAAAKHKYNPSRISFLDLPGEIRNQIYRYALVRAVPVDGRRAKIPAVPLLRVCRKIWREAASILYGENTFTFGIEIWISMPKRLGLHCFPLRLDVWPASRYHGWVRKFHIGLSFNAGSLTDFMPTAMVSKDIIAMRKAYDACWDELDITYEVCEGTAQFLTFTTAWLKFRCLAPLAHPNCKVVTQDDMPALVRWCLIYTLTGRDLRESLHQDQLDALREARQIAEGSYHGGSKRLCVDLAWRLVWGCPFEGTRGATVVPLFGQTVLPAAPGRRRIYDRREMFRRLETGMKDKAVMDILLEDNEWRTLAALDMPQEKELLIEHCAELQVYFKMQEMAGHLLAMKESVAL